MNRRQPTAAPQRVDHRAFAGAIGRLLRLSRAKRGMTRNQRVWAQNYLLGLQTSGLIDAEEEFRQPVFHITVYRDYDPLSQPVAARPAEEPVPQTVE